MGVMPVDKAISWPSSQESCQSALVQSLAAMGCDPSTANQAPLEGRAVDQAPVLLAVTWLKNEQLSASHTG
jgi:hypothetical protein